MEAERHRQKSLERQAEAWKLRLQGRTQESIAAELGISQQAVSLHLGKIEKRLFKEFVTQAEEIKARQTAQLEQVFATAIKQWRRSCEDAERVTVVTGRASASPLGVMPLPDLETTVKEGQSGNAALLAQAMKALADIRAIWGLEAPKKQELTGANGGPIEIDSEALRNDLQRRLAGLAAGSGAGSVPGEPDPA